MPYLGTSMDNSKMFWMLCLMVLNCLDRVQADGACDVSKNTINCKNRHFTDVPKLPYTPNCQILYLNYNNIDAIPANAFANVSETSELHLYLDHNSISFIDKNAFENIENVTVRLFLQQNNFTANSSLFEALEVFTNLTHLSVDGIDSLDSFPVSALNASLEFLSLGLDNFAGWPVQLQWMTHIHTLKVSGITQPNIIQINAFKGMEQSLEFLEIKNSVIDAPLDALCTLSNLQTLTVDFVKLNNSNAILPNCTLHSVWLVSFRFVNFPSISNLFGAYPNIQSLEISFNKELQLLSEDLIPKDNKVTHLNLMNNKFRQIPFAIQKMKHLEILDLSHNLISEIENNDIGELLELRRLVITHNPIVIISDHAFSRLPSMTHLDMRYLMLTSAPDALKQAGNLTSVDLRGNPVVCHCKMIWLLSPPIIKTLRGSCHSSNQLYLPIVQFLNSKCTHGP